MSLSRLKNISLVVISICLAATLWKAKESEKEKSLALSECIEDVTFKCGAVISYALLLENENARLNRMCKTREN